MKKPAARAPAKSKKTTEEPEEEESEKEEIVDDTQHYSPSQSPVSPKNLAKNFDAAAAPNAKDETSVGGRRAAKRKASDEAGNPMQNEKKQKKKTVQGEDDNGMENPPKPCKRSQKAADTETQKTSGKRTKTKQPEEKKDGQIPHNDSKTAMVSPQTKKPEEKKDGKIPHDDDGKNAMVSKRGSGPRVSFAGRVSPKNNEHAKQRHEVMVTTYMDQIGPFVTNGSQVEDRCSKKFFVFDK